MKELKIDNETFWGLEEGQYKDILQIKDFGTRKTLLKTVTDTKNAHKKAFEKQEKLNKKLTQVQIDGVNVLSKKTGPTEESIAATGKR